MSEWHAHCTSCGWSFVTPTYTEAGEAARDHGGDCEDASTEVVDSP